MNKIKAVNLRLKWISLIVPLTLFFLTLLLRIPTFWRPFDLAYEFQLAFFGREAFAGEGFYATPWSMKPPGESFVFGLVYILFGSKNWVFGVRFLTAVLAGLGSIYMYKLLNNLYGRLAALTGSLFFTLYLSRNDVFAGTLAYAEMMMPLFTILGVFLFFLAKEKHDKLIFFFAGLSLGFSLLFKQSAVYDFLPFFLYGLVESLLSREKLSQILVFYFFFWLGFILPLGTFLFYIILAGRLSLLWDWMIIKPMLYSKLREKNPGGYISSIFKGVFLVWVLSYLGMLGTFLRKDKKRIVFITWFFFTFLTFLSSGKFWNYYFIQPFIPACFLAGSFIGDVSYFFKKRILIFLLITTLFIILFKNNYQPYKKSFKNYLSVIQKKVTLENYIFSQSDGQSWINRYQTANFLKKISQKEDKVFVMEGTPAIYVLADKMPAFTDFIFEQQFFENKSIGFAFNHSYQNVQENQKLLLKKMQENAPSYIILVIESSADAEKKTMTFPEFFAFTFNNYSFLENFADVWVYKLKGKIVLPEKVIIEKNFAQKYSLPIKQ